MPDMRNPIRSEADAFRLTVAAVALAVVSVLLGWLLAPLVGVAVFVLVGAVALGAYLRTPEHGRRQPLREAARESRPHRRSAHGRHVLVVANRSLGGEELRRRIAGRDDDGGARVQVDVLAPVLASRAHLAVTDIDDELREADERLQRSLAWARAEGFAVRGEVGDPAGPTTAIEDELRAFGADEVIVVTSSADVDDRQEREQLRRLRGELDVPVVHLAAD
jgi:hypothetical protein